MDAKELNRERALVQLGAQPSGASTKRRIQAPAEQSPLNGVVILVVEDEPSAAELATGVLTARGYTVITSPSVKGAIEQLHAHSDIALILCDLRLQGEDGFDLAQFVNQNLRFNDIPFIMCSSCALGNVVRRALDLGAADYIAKPYAPATLIAKVEGILQVRSWSALLVSNDALSLELLSRILRRGRCDCVTAASGSDALQVLQRCRVDVVITDLGLADCSGPELMTEIKESGHNVPVFLIGDFSSRVKEEEAVAAGAHGLIARPFYGFDIVRRIRAAIRDNRRKRGLSRPE